MEDFNQFKLDNQIIKRKFKSSNHRNIRKFGAKNSEGALNDICESLLALSDGGAVALDLGANSGENKVGVDSVVALCVVLQG